MLIVSYAHFRRKDVESSVNKDVLTCGKCETLTYRSFLAGLLKAL